MPGKGPVLGWREGWGEETHTRAPTCQEPGSQQGTHQRKPLRLSGHDPVWLAGHCPLP